MNIECWGGRGKQIFINITSVEYLRYDRFWHNI